MPNNAEIKSEYSRIRALMLKRIGRALEQKPQNKTLLKEQAKIKQHNIRDYFNALSEKQQKRALETLQRKTENDKLRVQRTQKPKAKSDLDRQVEDYRSKRTTLLNRLKSMKGKPDVIDRYINQAEHYITKTSPSEFKKMTADERYNKLLTLYKMNADPLLTMKGMKAEVNRQKELLKANGYTGGVNWKEEMKQLQQKKHEERKALGEEDINEEDMNYWYHSGSVHSNAIMKEHNEKLGYKW